VIREGRDRDATVAVQVKIIKLEAVMPTISLEAKEMIPS
jgi:hypothetical protein